MKQGEIFDKEANEANIKLNQVLEDGKVQGSTKGLPESEGANLKLQEAFYGDDKKDKEIPPLYLRNNMPAIKINENND